MTGPGAGAADPAPLGWRGVGTFYAGFVAGVVLATWPLALHPATTWPDHHDPRLFTWVMAATARRLLTDPLNLFHGNALYPFGQSLAFSEVLVAPSLLGLPGFVWGNPILTYNLLLLTLWPANGAAMAWVAYRLTGSRPAAWLAGAVFCLSPYFTEYHVEFQMLLAAPVPVIVFAWVRWLEAPARRWLVLMCAGLAVQGLTTWYYTIIVGLGLVTTGLGFLALRWTGWQWRRRLLELGAGALLVAAVLYPFARPYLAIREELGFERGLAETAAHYADLFTFLEPGWRSLVYDLDLAGHFAETSTFVGFSVLILAGASVVWLPRDAPLPVAARPLARAARLAFGAMTATALLLLLAPLPRAQVGRLVIHLKPAEFLDLAVLFGLTVLAIHGWAVWRERRPRRLAEGDWVRLLLLLAAVFAILSLGPVVHVRRDVVGTGPYLSLYHVLLPLHVVRITARFAILTIAALALLSALGLAALEARLASRRWARRLVLAAVFLVVALEYAVVPPEYEPVAWAPRPVDAALRAVPGDVAILEWPTHAANADTDAMFRSLIHDKRVVNGHSGFVPDLIREFSAVLTMAGPPFPGPEAEASIRRIYPLRYLVVRLGDGDLPRDWVPPWLAVRRSPPPWLRHVGTYHDDDLYEVLAPPERAARLERWVSYDFLRRHPRLALDVRPLVADPSREAWLDVTLNERRVERIPLAGRIAPVVALTPPYRLAAPNVIRLDYGYRRPAALDGRYGIGQTGVRSPVDIRVVSVGEPFGSASSIRLNGTELSPDGRGYNLVALDPTGQVLGARVFDTFFEDAAAPRLAAWVRALPAGAVVAGAVRDEASESLTGDAVGALRSLGVAGDLRGHFREAHAFVGVKGAAPGTAVEALGNRPIELTVGRPEAESGFELLDFTLKP